MASIALDFDNLFAITSTPLMVLDTSLHFIAANHCYLGITARRWEDIAGRHVFDAFPERGERLVAIRDSFERALAGESNSLEKLVFAIERPQGGFQDAWWTCQQQPVCDADGTIIGVMQHTRDVTSEVAAERMRDVISLEYGHRVRNLLAKVSAIARRTARSADSMQQFIADFDPRILAMARAHELLVHGGWEQLGLAELVTGELKPYVTQAENQLQIAGPNVALSSHVAQALGMALHELATNAVKHGALSQPSGHLEVVWNVGASDDALHLVWIESGLNGLQTPRPNGFGSTIIDRILPAETGGTVTREFRPTGLVCTIEIPGPTRT
jgi:two-component sensor histidine kinase